MCIFLQQQSVMLNKGDETLTWWYNIINNQKSLLQFMVF
jgi:hypothetical protein